ncbi:hypothetical protein C5S53_14680 [Methanophagales archaeon]|jgi:hypothetical protein|nr:hypothetical protein C5S53_14680 [Methanophagales archaeon]
MHNVMIDSESVVFLYSWMGLQNGKEKNEEE